MRVQLGQSAALYCRVSTADQTCARQERDLRAFAKKAGYKVAGVWKETASGAKNERSERKQVLALAQARNIDVILVTELTRWGRSMLDLFHTLQDLQAWGISLVAQTGLQFDLRSAQGKLMVHPVNGEVPPVKGRPWKLPHYANRGKTTSSGGELASARSCFSTVRTALGKLRITGLLAQFDVARSFPQFPRPLLLQPTILTSERGTRFGIRKAPNHVPTSPFTG